VEILFGDYELLANSGLFDAAYYVKSNPDVAATNMDPLLHYLEYGCLERRDPGPGFDTAHYLRLCESIGEAPINALAHYLSVGMSRGFTPSGAANPSTGKGASTGKGRRAGAAPGVIASPQRTSDARRGVLRAPTADLLRIDIPRVVNGVAETPVQGGLSIVGWGVAVGGISAVDIELDGVRVTSARCGLRRPDVAAAHPDWDDALLSGYAAHLSPKVLAVGRHRVSVLMRGRGGHVSRMDFSMEVHEVPGDRGACALRQKMSQAEVDFKRKVLDRLHVEPVFHLYLPVQHNTKIINAAQRTIRSVSRQKYPGWELRLVPEGPSVKSARQRAALEALILAGLDRPPAPGKISWAASEAWSGAGRCFISRLGPGDELGCDALLEFALAIGFEPGADLLYCDERRLDPVDGRMGAFFKPAWSPDLHLSTNYLGRAWCADLELLERAGISVSEICDIGDYEFCLRIAEAARRIDHVSKVLHQRADSGDTQAQERRALKGALQRRLIDGEIHAGCVPGYYRIERKLNPGKVSIVIPTCAAGGHIKTCLESLRARTSYQDYEIICIENIPESRQEAKDWLRAHADAVIETHEPFNWSAYNNQAVKRATGQYLLFLNDDVEIIEPGWLGALLEQAQRPEVGVVGPLLTYPDGSIQQAGVMLDAAGHGRHAFRHLPDNDPGYFGLALTQRNVLSMTGACLLTRRDTFESLGGFDEAHAVINNDLDFCLRAWRKGLINVYVPHAKLIHHELASRSGLDEQCDLTKFHQQWRDVIATGDPYFNPHLSREHEPFTVEREAFEVVHAGHPLFARSAVRRILVVKLDHIGDCITALPALRRLRQHFPAAHICVLAARATQEIWKSEPAVDESLEFNFFHARSSSGKIEVPAKEMQLLTQRLQAKRFDLAIDLRKQPDTRHVLEHAGADILAGFDTQGRFPWLDVALEWDEDVPLRTKHGHVADDLVALVEAVATQSDPHRPALLAIPTDALSLPASERRRLFSKPLICIHPAAGSPMRQWPAEKFADLIHLLLSRQRFNVALIGGPDEKELAAEVLGLAGGQPEVINLVGRLALADLPRLLGKAALFVGNNSGPHHLAAALGIPTVGIHSGVVDAREWGPLGPQAVAVRRDMSCSPCFIEYEKDCPRGLACLKELSVADVYETCRKMILDDTGPAPRGDQRVTG